jgi:uncharacterized damage-inducible protein DinB
LAHEDIHKWCDRLSDEELNARPAGVPSIAFHVNHIAGSLDRLLTYAEGRELGPQQVATVEGEKSAFANRRGLLSNFDAAIENSTARVRSFAGMEMEQPRLVSRAKLPSSLGGLLVHVADHTQRHVGQVVTTAGLVRASR